VIDALALIRHYARTRLRTFPAEETVPLDGIVRGLWRDAVVETDPHGRTRINRITYEICVLEALRERLRCKEIWVVGADRYRNPGEECPPTSTRSGCRTMPPSTCRSIPSASSPCFRPT
jgi:hypothetical protein